MKTAPSLGSRSARPHLRVVPATSPPPARRRRARRLEALWRRLVPLAAEHGLGPPPGAAA